MFKMCPIPSRLIPSKVVRSILGTGSSLEVRCPRKAWITRLECRYEYSAPTSSHATWNQSNRYLTKSLRSRSVPITSLTNRGDRGGQGCLQWPQWPSGGFPSDGAITGFHETYAWVYEQFDEPIQGNQTKLSKPPLVPKFSGLGFCPFPVFGGRRYDHHPYF